MTNIHNLTLIKGFAVANKDALIAEDDKTKAAAIPWYKTNAFIFGTMGTVLLIVIIIIATIKK